MRKVALITTLSAVALSMMITAAQAGNYPEKPLSLICWSSAGSGHDLMARMVAKVGEKYLGQPIAVMNKKGGKGKVAMSYVLNKKPDGYTIMTNTRSMTERLIDPNASLTVDSFQYISRVVKDPFVMLVNNDSPFNSIEELVAFAKKNPKKLKIGGYSVQSVDQKLVNKFMKATGADLTYIPYKGGMEPVVAVLGGHVDVAVANPSEMIANFKAGNVKVLASCSEKRFAPFDESPTLKELGIDVVEEHWRGIMASADLPEEQVKLLDKAIAQAIKDPEFQEFLVSSNMYDGYLPHQEFAVLVKKQTEENMTK